MKQPTISEVCTQVKNIWQGVTEKMIIKSFKNCGISNAINGTEDGAVVETNDINSLYESNTHGDINETILRKVKMN